MKLVQRPAVSSSLVPVLGRGLDPMQNGPLYLSRLYFEAAIFSFVLRMTACTIASQSIYKAWHGRHHAQLVSWRCEWDLPHKWALVLSLAQPTAIHCSRPALHQKDTPKIWSTYKSRASPQGTLSWPKWFEQKNSLLVRRKPFEEGSSHSRSTAPRLQIHLARDCGWSGRLRLRTHFGACSECSNSSQNLANLLTLTLSAWHQCCLRPRCLRRPSFQQRISPYKGHQRDAGLAHKANISNQLVAVLEAGLKLPSTSCVCDGAHQALAVSQGVVLPHTSAAHRWFCTLWMRRTGFRKPTPVPSSTWDRSRQAKRAKHCVLMDSRRLHREHRQRLQKQETSEFSAQKVRHPRLCQNTRAILTQELKELGGVSLVEDVI